MISLSTILKINAISSGAAGCGLIFFAKPIASIFGTGITAPFTNVGIFLVVFAAVVYWVSVRKPLNPASVRTVIWLDRFWVLGSVAAVTLLADVISLTGNLVIILVALWVGAMAMIQQKGLKSLQLKES